MPLSVPAFPISPYPTAYLSKLVRTLGVAAWPLSFPLAASPPLPRSYRMKSWEREISPPPPKRRRLVESARHDPSVLIPILSPRLPLLHKPTSLTVYSWNINGIGPFVQPSIASFMTKTSSAEIPSTRTVPVATSLRNFLRRHHWPQILNLQEVKINPSDLATQRAVENAVNKYASGHDEGPQYKVFFSLPRDQYNAKAFGRKVYGVATLMRTDFLLEEEATIREVDWDLEGRVLVVETKSKLSIWNIYAVNGTTSPYRDPKTGVVVGTRHDRKLMFHQLLLDECKQLEQDGYQVLLTGDMNIAPARIDGFPNLRTKPEQHVKNRTDFNEKFLDGGSGLRGIDTFRHLHPQQKKYTYHPRNVEWRTSCDRVDLIVASRTIVEKGMLVEAGIEEEDRGPSDHVPLYVTLNMECTAGLANTSDPSHT